MLKLLNSKISYFRVMAALDGSDHAFYLTGSRFFGRANKRSDWDFFTEYSDEVFKFLSSLGFKRLNASTTDKVIYPDDPNIAEVLEWRSQISLPDEVIQVQLVKDAELKLRAQYLLNESPIRSAFLEAKSLGGTARPWWAWAYRKVR